MLCIYVISGVSQQATPDPVMPRTFRKRSRSHTQSIGKNLKLSAEQKCDIATRELEELRESIEKMKEVAEKKLDNLRVNNELYFDFFSVLKVNGYPILKLKFDCALD